MDQSKLLLDYTTFHIGLYSAVVLAVIAACRFVGVTSSWAKWSLKIMVVLFAFAGASGGVIAGNLPEFGSFGEFSQALLGPFGLQLFTYETWARLEHGLFWMGVAIGVGSFLKTDVDQAKRIGIR